MPTKTDLFSPHHVGEALCERLLDVLRLERIDAIGGLPVLDPRDDRERTVADVLGGAPRVLRIHAGAPLAKTTERTFDGMHDIDCALELADRIVAVELKLGTTGMQPDAFRRRFVEKRPQARGKKIDGSMVALLDWNRRTPHVDAGPLELRSLAKPVAPGWLLMVRDETLARWRLSKPLRTMLGTEQLVGVLSFESVARAVGIDRAKSVAKKLVSDEIDAWSF